MGQYSTRVLQTSQRSHATLTLFTLLNRKTQNGASKTGKNPKNLLYLYMYCMLLYMWDSKTVPKKQNCFQNCTFYSVVDWLHAADFKSVDLWFKSYHLPMARVLASNNYW